MLYAFLIAFLTSFVLNFFFVPLGKKMRALKTRSGGSGVSKLGGIGIVVSFYIAVLFVASFVHVIDRKLIVVLCGVGATFLLGFVDDLVDLAPYKKLFFQFSIAVFLVGSGIRTEIIVLPKFLNVLLSIFWFLALMNAFNFLDILDGLAAGISCVCAATFLYISTRTGNLAAGLIAAALLGSNLSFLRFNLPQAKLYMGDMGSLFNGVVLGAAAIMISYASLGREAALFVPLLILALPLYDLFFVIVMRLIDRKSIVRKSRDHFVLRLMDRGVPVPRAVFLMYLFTFLFNLAALLLLRSSNAAGFLILSSAALGWLLVAGFISGKVRGNEG